MKQNSYLILLYILFCLFSFAFVKTKAKDSKPNIIFFFTDDQAYNTLGIYGNTQVKTPNLDKLGRDGIVFDRHYSTSAVSMASHANVMSGCYEYKSGCNFYHGPMFKHVWETSYPMLLKKAGYRIGFAGTLGFCVSNKKNRDIRDANGVYAQQFFDDWKGGDAAGSYNTLKHNSIVEYATKYPHSTLAYGAATIDFIKESKDIGKPFCMSLYFKAPHNPMIPDSRFKELYKNVEWKKPMNFGREAGAHLAKQSKTGHQYTHHFSEYFEDEDKRQEYMKHYHQLVYGVDIAVGMVLEALKEMELEENTIIIFSSSNGAHHGAHGLGGDAFPYEESAHVPLLIYDPTVEHLDQELRSKALTGNVDIPATILDYAGVEIPSHYDGVSLKPVIECKKKHVRKTLPIIQVYGEESSRCFSILTEEFKYIYWYYLDEQIGIKPTEELFALSDRFEMHNLANDVAHKKTLVNMRKSYDKQIQHWREESVLYNGYCEYGVLFHREIEWPFKGNMILHKDNKLITFEQLEAAKKIGE